jgi:hypothetical protein
VPAWLRGADDAPPPAPAGRDAPSAPADDDVPAWLRGADDAPPPAPAGRAAPGAPADDDVPAWLRGADDAPAAPARGAEGGMPDWLREMEPGDATPPPPAPVAPSWLHDDDDTPPGAAEGAASSPPAPAWLREDLDEARGSQPAAEARREPQAPPAGDLPPWLAAEDLTPPAGGSPVSPGAGDMALPSWLRGVADEPAPPSAGSPAAREQRGPEEAPRRSAAPPKSTPADSEGDDFLRGADLPSWLRPAESERAAESPEAQTFDWLTRLGASEQEEEAEAGGPALTALTQSRRPSYQRSTEQVAAVALLSQLVRAPYPEAAPAPLAETPSRWRRIGLDRVLYLLLALALLAGLLVPQISAPLQTAAPTAPGASELSEAVAGLTSDDVVLVAYEWGAQRSAELRPLEQAVMQRLAANKVKLILVSTDLQGSLLSFDQRENLRAAGYNIEPDGREFGGRDYVLLGYRPGGELALRSIARDLRAELRSDFNGQDATQGLLASNIESIRDVSMILVMADQPQDVQSWMEQVRSAAPEVPIAFLLPQEAQPLVQPYLALDGVYHLAGLPGALAFGVQSPGADQAALARSAGQLSLAIVMFVALLLVGAVGAAISRARRRRGGAA